MLGHYPPSMRIPVLALSFLLAAALTTSAQRKPFSVVEATIPEMQAAMKAKQTTSREIVQQYLARIALYEDKLHAAITINPNAIKEAEALDQERARGKI